MDDPLLEKRYNELYQAIGYVVQEWASLELAVSDLIFDLCTLYSDAFYENDNVFRPYAMISANIDLRSNIACAKALAFDQRDIPNLHERLDPVLNVIGNELRNSRNRFVHDRWVIWGSKIMRIKDGTTIRREPGSGAQTLSLSTGEEYTDTNEIRTVGDKIYQHHISILRFGTEIQEAYQRKFPEPE